jgi:hypothetical protein
MNIECHIPKARWNSDSAMAAKIRSAVKAGEPGFAHYLPRGSITYKMFVTVPLDSTFAPKVLELAETVVLRDLEPPLKAALEHGGIVQAWAYVYYRAAHKGTREGLLRAIETMKAYVAKRNAEVAV